jgi:hypothetical protein
LAVTAARTSTAFLPDRYAFDALVDMTDTTEPPSWSSLTGKEPEAVLDRITSVANHPFAAVERNEQRERKRAKGK